MNQPPVPQIVPQGGGVFIQIVARSKIVTAGGLWAGPVELIY